MQRLAQPPLPALPPSQQQLTTSALQLFTERFPASPRKTVHRYLSEQRAHAGSYLPAVIDTLSPAPASPPRTSRVKRRLSSDDRAETALVLHSDEVQGGPGWLSGNKASRPSKEGEGGASSSATKKKPSLVAAMKPKMTSLVHGSALAITSEERRGTKGRSKSKETRARPSEQDRDSGSSPLLVARADAKENERRHKGEEEAGGYSTKRKASAAAERKANVASKDSSKERNGKGKATEEEPLPEPARKKSKKQDDLLGEDEGELADRLRARKERRRAKAVIVKDRTQPAKAVGAAAASKVKSAHRKSKRQRGSDEEASSDEEEPAPESKSKKKQRKASNAELNKELQDGNKAKNVGASRLTLKVPIKLGLFHNGAASVQTKVGKKLPDLAFSELNFLNAPRPSPPAPSDSSSSSSPSAAAHRSSKPQPTVKTYGSKIKKHRSSKYFEAASSDSSSDLPAPTAARKTKSRKESGKAEASIRSRPLPPSPPRAPTPKKSKSKAKRKASPPPPSPTHTTESSELHSAQSREQRRSRSAQEAARQSQPHARQLEEAVLDTSSFWKRDRPDHQHQDEREATPDVVQDRSASPALDHPRSSLVAVAAPTALAPPPNFNPNYALSSSRSSASIDRLLQACEAGVYPPAVAPRPRPHHPESLVDEGCLRISSGLGMGAASFQVASHHGQSSLRFSSLAGSSTEEVRREVARGVVMGEDGVFKLVENSQGQDVHPSFDVAGRASEAGGRSSVLLGAGPEVGGGGSAWMEVPMDARSLAPTIVDDEEDLHFDQLPSFADDDSIPPPPQHSSHAVDLFSHRQQYQEEQDSYLGFVGAGTFGDGSGSRGGKASAEDEAFRSAMKSHWYKTKC